MKSCQTSSPSSSQRSWNAGGLVDADARRRGPCSCPRRAAASQRRAQLASGTGVHTAPRAKTGTPLTASASASRSASKPGRAPARGTRRPAAAPTRPVEHQRTSCSAGAPCVCGHQRSAPGTRTSPRSAAVGIARRDGAAPATLHPTPRTSPAHARRDGQDAVVALHARAQRHLDHTTARAGARATPAATARRSAARARTRRPARGSPCARSAARRRSSTTLVRQRCRGRRGARASTVARARDSG